MSNYTKATNFTAKDSLTTGDPSKVVLGAEIDTEYTAIETAIATKADIASPTFTGTVTLPNTAGNRTDTGNITHSGTITMSGKPIYQAEGAAVASAGTTDIWTPADGDTVHVTGTTTITSFGTAPQAGAMKRIIFDGALILTQGANLNLNAGGSNITTAADDVAFVYADTTTQMDVLVIRKSGSPIGQVPGSLGGGWTYIETKTASASASLSTTAMSATYSDYAIVLRNLLPATNQVELNMTFNSDTAGNYGRDVLLQGAVTEVGDAETSIQLAFNVSNTTDAGGVSGIVFLPGLRTAKYKNVTVHNSYTFYTGAADSTGKAIGTGLWRSTSEVTNISIQFASGNIVNGAFELYGLKNS